MDIKVKYPMNSCFYSHEMFHQSSTWWVCLKIGYTKNPAFYYHFHVYLYRWTFYACPIFRDTQIRLLVIYIYPWYPNKTANIIYPKYMVSCISWLSRHSTSSINGTCTDPLSCLLLHSCDCYYDIIFMIIISICLSSLLLLLVLLLLDLLISRY